MSENIIIDPEFKALLDPLSEQERAQLEANVLADGCRDPLIVWRVRDADQERDMSAVSVLVDGHNRYEICTRHGIAFDVEEMEFADRDAAMDWIDANQLGRRNLSPTGFTLALGRRYNRQKKSKAEAGAIGGASKDQIDTCLPTTADKLAQQHDVSAPTVKRAGQFAAAVDTIERAAPGFTSHAADFTRQDVVKAAEVVEAVPEAAQDLALAADFAQLPALAKADAIATIGSTDAPAIEVMRDAVKKAHVANNSGNNEWYTPADYIALARKVMGGIDTDPATSEIANRTVQAAQIFTAEDNGLTKQWSGRVWCNPPYAQPLIAEFAEAIASKFEAGEIEQACVLVNNGTETGWFQRMLQAASAVCFPRSRIRFVDPEGNPSGAPLQGQAVLYLGKEPETFASVFSEKGAVLFNG